MKNLNDVVLDALDLHASYELPELDFPGQGKRLVVGSGNALPTAKIVFKDDLAVFVNETQVSDALDKHADISCATVISASGSKHAPIIVRDLLSRGVSTSLITCRDRSEASDLLPEESVFVTRSNAEPITYNTSTYLGMILAKTREDPRQIKDHLLSRVLPEIPDFREYEAFYLIVPSKFEVEREMFVTKFDELFGGRVAGRCYTHEQTMHAKTVVTWDRELFISFGFPNESFGLARCQIPFPDEVDFGAMLCIGYYVIGHIQAQLPPWFKQHAKAYEEFQKNLFAEQDEAS